RHTSFSRDWSSDVCSSDLRNGDGTYARVDDGSIQYDTLADGRLLYKNLPGQFQREEIANYSNFRDGDRQSSLNFRAGDTDSAGNANFNMYNAPRKNFFVDGSGRVVVQKDSQARTSAITNEIRVVKGGSWQDTAYWLDPGQR